jgi:hypothetical protein
MIDLNLNPRIQVKTIQVFYLTVDPGNRMLFSYPGLWINMMFEYTSLAVF